MVLNYQKTNWVNNETKLNADNMNNIENGIKNASDIIDDISKKVKSVQLFDRKSVTTGFLLTNGKIYTGGSYDSYVYTDYIDVSGNQGRTMMFSRVDNYNLIASHTRVITAYDESKTVIPNSGASSEASSYTVPSGVSFIRLTFYATYADIFQAEWDVLTIPSEYFDPFDMVIPKSIGNRFVIERKFESVSGNVHLKVISGIHNKKNDTISLWCKFDEFSLLNFGHGYQVLYGSWISIDNTNIRLLEGESSKVQATAEHGLTISEFLSITISRHQSNSATITVTTLSGSYSVNWQMQACNGDIFFSTATALTDVSVSVNFADANTDAFLFGDSYTSLGDSARYPKYLLDNGYTNIMMIGYGGATSTAIIDSLKRVLKYATPKYIVWTLGMNDGTDGDSYPDSWKAAIDYVIDICNKNSITPIFATIPCVPSISHVKKNEWVKSSGYRYIDFAKAVGAESEGSTWYTDMLSTDNVHPSQTGAKALAARFMVDFPESYK